MRTVMRQILVSVAEQTGLSLIWSKKNKDRFSDDEAHFIMHLLYHKLALSTIDFDCM